MYSRCSTLEEVVKTVLGAQLSLLLEEKGVKMGHIYAISHFTFSW